MVNSNESEVKKAIENLEDKLMEAKKQLVELRRTLPRQEIDDYQFIDGGNNPVKLSELFGSHKELILIHNMGKNCAYCTLWADEFNGMIDHLENRAGFVVVSSDSPEEQKEFAQSRGWRFKMVSALNSSFTKDMGFETDGKYLPGVSTFIKEANGKIYRAAYDTFGPGDNYCGIWHLFELLPEGPGEWSPRFKY
ncbi:MAG: DUF899 domain-containing protein [candidate division Zixibacteria bacterium]|nr:DUF899 domain-containing protein [candidate division Zixibacteria bacterium]